VRPLLVEDVINRNQTGGGICADTAIGIQKHPLKCSYAKELELNRYEREDELSRYASSLTGCHLTLRLPLKTLLMPEEDAQEWIRDLLSHDRVVSFLKYWAEHKAGKWLVMDVREADFVKWSVDRSRC